MTTTSRRKYLYVPLQIVDVCSTQNENDYRFYCPNLGHFLLRIVISKKEQSYQGITRKLSSTNVLYNCPQSSYAYKCTSFAVFYCWYCSNCFNSCHIVENNPILPRYMGFFLGNACKARQVIRVNTING